MAELRKITICITCYREGPFLKECWDSVLGQNYSDWEAVLVKDGGSDETTDEIFTSLEHPRLKKYALDENMGPYFARNKAIEMAKSKIIMLLDGDDTLPANSLTNLVDVMEATNADYAYGQRKYFGEVDSLTIFSIPINIRDIYRNLFPGTIMLKKTVWEELGRYIDKGELGKGNADLDFQIGLLENNYKAAYCNSVTYLYRKHSAGQVSKSYKTNYLTKRKIIIKNHPLFFKRKIIKKRFLGYGALFDAVGFSRLGNYRQARKLALQAILHGCLERPSVWKLLLTGKPFNFY
jgi:glycosyltransferase involved in cell wall biosynthesis